MQKTSYDHPVHIDPHQPGRPLINGHGADGRADLGFLNEKVEGSHQDHRGQKHDNTHKWNIHPENIDCYAWQEIMRINQKDRGRRWP